MPPNQIWEFGSIECPLLICQKNRTIGETTDTPLVMLDSLLTIYLFVCSFVFILTAVSPPSLPLSPIYLPPSTPSFLFRLTFESCGGFLLMCTFFAQSTPLKSLHMLAQSILTYDTKALFSLKGEKKKKKEKKPFAPNHHYWLYQHYKLSLHLPLSVFQLPNLLQIISTHLWSHC